MSIEKLFSGKKKFITIPILGIIGLTYLPITLGVIAIWFSYKKISNESVKTIAISIFGILTIFFGTAWIVTLFSPSSSIKENIPKPTQEVSGARTTPTDFELPTTTPTLNPSSTSTTNPTPTTQPTSKPTVTTQPTIIPTSTPYPNTPTLTQTPNTSNQNYSPPVNSGGYTCNCQKTCGNMSSCGEAYFQLNTCGCQARDGDNDGVPCESICN